MVGAVGASLVFDGYGWIARRKKDTSMASKSGPADIRKIFDESELELLAAFNKSAAVKHNGSKGTIREDQVADFLREQLPGRYQVVRGELIDSEGNRSRQLDTIIIDRNSAAPFLRGRDTSEWILPVEAALAVIEVKSQLNSTELRSIAENVVSIHQLRPWNKKFSVVAGYREELAASSAPRLQYSVFAFGTDLVERTWAATELSRARLALKRVGAMAVQLDRLLVLNRGMLHVAKGTALTSGEQGVLLDWFLTLVNYLEREAGRRKPIPFDRYRARGNRGWQRIAQDEFPIAEEKRIQHRAAGSSAHAEEQTSRTRSTASGSALRAAPLLRAKLGPGRADTK